MASSGDVSESAPQRVADRYSVVAELGSGGVGRVYEAVDERTGRRVALKQMSAQARGLEELVTLFKREYYTLKQLSHPLFVEVYEYGVDDTGPFFTMELVPGQDAARCAPLPWRETCRVLRDVASGLAVLHSRGLVYRDLSARNVRIGDDGQARLLDFGAMASRDVPQPQVVGTAPFVAPESVHGQPLDARTDLYALGALGYYLLTHSHAYPAQHVHQLRDHWRSPPRPPSSHGVECPRALDELLLSLLGVDRHARPAHAAEVIDRLNALAELTPLPAAQAARAYLNRPPLVERTRETLAIRKQLVRMLRGRGGAVSIEAAPGMGRTRLLEELVLEAKLMGAAVLHAASRAGAAHYDTIRQLCSQLLAALPEMAADAAAPFAPALRAIVPELGAADPAAGDSGGEGAAADADERWADAQAALVGWLEAVARRCPLVVAVDDLQHCDDASVAAIAGLALRAREQRVLVVATLAATGAREWSGPLAAFREHAEEVALAPLGADATFELYRHVFGDVAYLPELASWAERIARGSPQHCMTLANDLVDRGVIRYDDGVWVLPLDLQQQVLPTSLTQAFAQRLRGLSAPARALAELLSVAGEPVSLASCMAWCAEQDEASVFAALDELLAADLVLCDGQVYAFRQPAIRDAVDAQLDDGRRRACHRCIGLARAAREPRDTTERLHVARHLLRGGEDGLGVDHMLAALARIKDPTLEVDERGLDAMQLALHACERQQRPSTHAMRIRLALLPCAFWFDHALVDLGLPVVERLERDSGISELGEQDPGKSMLERVVQALGKAGERFQQLPEAERLFDPVRSTVELGKSLLAMQAIYSTQFDLPKATACCVRFEPIAALTPMAKLCHDAALAALDGLVGRMERAYALQEDVVVRGQALLAVMQAAGDGQQIVALRALLASIAYVVALRNLSQRPQESLRLADLIDRVAPVRHKAGAAQLRVLASYMMGDADATARFQADYEQRLVRFRQHGSSGVDLSYRIRVYELGRDLLHLNALEREALALSERRPGYRPFVHLCRGHSFGLRGQHERALAEYERAVELSVPGQHSAWAPAISHVVRTLVELHRTAEAHACIERARRLNAEHDLGQTFETLVAPALAQLEVLDGDAASAVARLQEALTQATQADQARLVRGELVVALLRVALIARDRALFERHALELQELYRGTGQRGLHEAYEHLLQRARAENLIEGAAVARALDPHAAERSRVAAALGACRDDSERASCALSLLVDALQARGGYLFALSGGRLSLVAALPERSEPPAGMESALTAYLSAELAGDDVATAASVPGAVEPTTQIFEDNRRYRAIVLRAASSDGPVIAGIAALEIDRSEIEPQPHTGLVAALSEQLVRQVDSGSGSAHSA